jgi:hypothetical protein
LVELERSLDAFGKRARTAVRGLKKYERALGKRGRALERVSPMKLYGVERSKFLSVWIRGILTQLDQEVRALRNDSRSAASDEPLGWPDAADRVHWRNVRDASMAIVKGGGGTTRLVGELFAATVADDDPEDPTTADSEARCTGESPGITVT